MPTRPTTFKRQRAKTEVHLSKEQSWGNGRGGRPWRRLRESILSRDNYLCQCEECQSKGLFTLANEVDHIIPKSQGGTDDIDNLRSINKKCHEKKTNREKRT